MKKLLLLSIVILTLISCTSSNKSLTEGKWVDKEKEFMEIAIVSENKAYWLVVFNEKSPILEKDGKFYIMYKNKELPITLNKDTNVLFLGDKEYIPWDKSLKNQFVGNWENKNKGIIFKIKKINGGLVWDILEGDNKPERYYPKLTSNGFIFTFKDQDVFFVIENGCIKDSEGNKYCKSSKG
jgi:hypothetical protein